MATVQREIRYLTAEELICLRRYAEARALQAKERGAVTAVRSWALHDTLLSSGLRASEVAGLRVGDCLLGYGQGSLVVRQGKGDKQREVFIPQELKTHLKAFLTWKRDHGEDVSEEAIVFTGQRGSLTRNGVWRLVKGLMASVGLDPRYATHTCRHTTRHNLARLLPAIRGIFDHVGWNWQVEVPGVQNWEDVSALVRAIDGIDGGSSSFRYPVASDGSAPLPRHLVLNAIAFGHRMDLPLDLLDGAVTGLDDFWKRQVQSGQNAIERRWAAPPPRGLIVPRGQSNSLIPEQVS